MTEIADINLQSAIETFAVANTPAFVWMRLPRDESVQRLARAVSEEEIFSALKDALNKEPATLVDSAMPYILVAALGIARATKSLRQAESLPPGPYLWFSTVTKALAQTYTPTMVLKSDDQRSHANKQATATTTKRFILME